MLGIFGDFFDFNHDGQLDGFERAAEFATFMSIIDEEEQRNKESLFDEDYEVNLDDDMDLF